MFQFENRFENFFSGLRNVLQNFYLLKTLWKIKNFLIPF